MNDEVYKKEPIEFLNSWTINYKNSFEKARELIKKEQEGRVKTIEYFNFISKRITESLETMNKKYSKILKSNLSCEEIYVYNNEKAENIDDKGRHFIDILFYPIGRRWDTHTFDTPTLEFEALPNIAHISIKCRTDLSNKPLKPIKELDVNKFEQNILLEEANKYILDFMKVASINTSIAAASIVTDGKI
jgi:hypothetical protein